MDEKNIQRILREQDRVAMHMQMTMEEHKSLTEVCQGIREQLTSDRQAAYDIEESLKVLVAVMNLSLYNFFLVILAVHGALHSATVFVMFSSDFHLN